VEVEVTCGILKTARDVEVEEVLFFHDAVLSGCLVFFFLADLWVFSACCRNVAD
jgi:diphthamide synthase subunit DPH2